MVAGQHNPPDDHGNYMTSWGEEGALAQEREAFERMQPLDSTKVMHDARKETFWPIHSRPSPTMPVA